MKKLHINYDRTYHYDFKFNENDLQFLKDILLTLGFEKEIVDEVDFELITNILYGNKDKIDNKFNVNIVKFFAVPTPEGNYETSTLFYSLISEIQKNCLSKIYDYGWTSCDDKYINIEEEN